VLLPVWPTQESKLLRRLSVVFGTGSAWSNFDTNTPGFGSDILNITTFQPIPRDPHIDALEHFGDSNLACNAIPETPSIAPLI